MTPAIVLQQQEIFVRGNEVFLKKVSGEVIQLTNDGKKKYDVLPSPSGRWVVYRGEPVRDRAMLQLDITIIDVQDPASKKTIHHDTSLRSLTRIEWLNEHDLALIGETNAKNDYYAIFDAKVKGVVTELVGTDFQLSPNRSGLVYLSFIPRGTPAEFFSHYVELFDLSDRESGPRHDRKRYAQILYPDHDPDKPFGDLDERHFVRSNLAWSPDNRSLAFVEEYRRAYWVTILDLLEDAEGVKVANIRRFRLAKKGELLLGDGEQVTWEGTEALTISGEKYLWDEVNQMTRKGPNVQWRINLTTGDVLMTELSQGGKEE
jgi:hypothetical protein